MNIEVLRYETGEVLEGQLNGRNLAAAIPETAVEESSGAASATAEATDGPTYSGYTTVTDDSGALEMEVPTEWSDVRSAPLVDNGETVGPGVWASADYDAYIDTWGEPGVFFGASRSLVQAYSVDEFLDSKDYSDSCDYDDRYTYEDELYVGKYDLWVNCGEEGSTFVVLAAVPENQEYLTEVNIQMLSEADFEAGDRILNTFQVVGEIE
jgi:serine protease Do